MRSLRNASNNLNLENDNLNSEKTQRGTRIGESCDSFRVGDVVQSLDIFSQVTVGVHQVRRPDARKSRIGFGQRESANRERNFAAVGKNFSVVP